MPTVPKRPSPSELDPLYVIFEQHLFNFEDSEEDRKTFVLGIVQDYIAHLRSLKIVIPRNMEYLILEELFAQVNTMLSKKMYGCLSIDDYRKGVLPGLKRRARSRYTRLAKARTVAAKKSGGGESAAS